MMSNPYLERIKSEQTELQRRMQERQERMQSAYDQTLAETGKVLDRLKAARDEAGKGRKLGLNQAWNRYTMLDIEIARIETMFLKSALDWSREDDLIASAEDLLDWFSSHTGTDELTDNTYHGGAANEPE